MEARTAQHGGDHDGHDLERAHRDGDGQMAQDHETARYRRGEQSTLSAALAIDDHADPVEDAAERHEQADRPNGHVRQVVDPSARCHRLGERRRDHHESRIGVRREGSIFDVHAIADPQKLAFVTEQLGASF